MNNLTVGFMGSGHFAALCLDIIARRVTPLWVLTNVPRTAGRGLKLQNTPVWELANSLNLPTFTTDKLSADTERISWLRENLPDLMIVTDFGHIIKEPVLSMAPLGCVNIHPSRLPQYRGSAPIQRALMDGCTKTAVTIFRLDAGMDTGPILAQQEIKITPSDNTDTLMSKAANLGSQTLLHYICDVAASKWRFTPQSSEGVSIAPKINKTEGKIDWNSQSAQEILNKIRAIGRAPGVYCIAHGKRLRVHSASVFPSKDMEPGYCLIKNGTISITCREGALKLIQVQPEGKKILKAEDWARGARIKDGEKIE